MSFIRRLARLAPALLLLSGVALPAAGQQEKPVDPDSLAGGPGAKLGLVINGFAAGNFNYNFNTDENSFESSVLALSLFRALSDRVSFFAPGDREQGGGEPLRAGGGSDENSSPGFPPGLRLGRERFFDRHRQPPGHVGGRPGARPLGRLREVRLAARDRAGRHAP